MAGLFLKFFFRNCPALILTGGYQVRTGVRAEDSPPAEPQEWVDVVVPVLDEGEMLPQSDGFPGGPKWLNGSP